MAMNDSMTTEADDSETAFVDKHGQPLTFADIKNAMCAEGQADAEIQRVMREARFITALVKRIEADSKE